MGAAWHPAAAFPGAGGRRVGGNTSSFVLSLWLNTVSYQRPSPAALPPQEKEALQAQIEAKEKEVEAAQEAAEAAARAVEQRERQLAGQADASADKVGCTAQCTTALV